jgi:hypothetical protein
MILIHLEQNSTAHELNKMHVAMLTLIKRCANQGKEVNRGMHTRV